MRIPIKVTQPTNGVKKETKEEQTEDVFYFRFKRHNSGNFKGLWQLARLDRWGAVAEEIKDADDLNTCISDIGIYFEDKGF